jgi:hypothetical protein
MVTLESDDKENLNRAAADLMGRIPSDKIVRAE